MTATHSHHNGNGKNGVQADLRRRYNRQVLLNCIREFGPVSRTDLAAMTHVRMAAITELTRELADEQLIFDVGAEDTPRGRKRRLLRLNDHYGYAIGIEFDADHIAGIVVNLTAEPVVRLAIEAPLAEQPDAIVEQLAETVGNLMEKANLGPDAVLGIGVADPGLVDRERGVSVMSSTLQGWRDIPLAGILGERFGVPVYLEENTRAKTFAEKRFGAARKVDEMMFVDVGPGVGCGVLTSKGLHRGHRGSAGEIGHTQVLADGPVCRCGSYGCLETVASLPAIARLAREAIQQGALSLVQDYAEAEGCPIEARHVFEAARNEDKLALSIIAQACRYLGIAIANGVNLLNPQMVVFDSSFQRIQDLMLEQIRTTVRQQALRTATELLEFRVSKLGPEAGALGAAAVVLDTVFEVPQLDVPEFV